MYYLKLDEEDGFYASAFISLAKRDFPLSLTSVMNKRIKTNITPSKDFVWNLTLVYKFR